MLAKGSMHQVSWITKNLVEIHGGGRGGGWGKLHSMSCRTFRAAFKNIETSCKMKGFIVQIQSIIFDWNILFNRKNVNKWNMIPCLIHTLSWTMNFLNNILLCLSQITFKYIKFILHVGHLPSWATNRKSTLNDHQLQCNDCHWYLMMASSDIFQRFT